MNKLKFFLLLISLQSVFGLQTGIPLAVLENNNQQVIITWQLPKNMGIQADSVKLLADNEILDYKLNQQPVNLNQHLTLINQVAIKANLPTNKIAKLQLNFQGCSIGGVCYPPQKQDFSLAKQSLVITLF